jgi:hypothetical protein
MADYKLRENITELKTFSVFIQDPRESDGGGWSYSARESDEFIILDWAGSIRKQYLPTLIQLLIFVAEKDVERHNIPAFNIGSMVYDTDEELADDVVESYSESAIGVDLHEMFIITTAHVEPKRRQVTTITVNRITDSYHVFVGSSHTLTFQSWEIEGITVLLQALAV